MSYTIPPFKADRLREALDSESLPVALGRSLPQLSERRDAAFRACATSRACRPTWAGGGERRWSGCRSWWRSSRRRRKRLGAVVHGPTDAAGAVATVRQVLHDHDVQMVVKSKSMATEEIELNPALEGDGIEVVETDLGEFLVQVAGERPSHIIAPALHITRERAAELISKATGEDLPPDPDVLVGAAARHSAQSVHRRRRWDHWRERTGGRNRHGDAGQQRGQRAAGQRAAAGAHRDCRASTSWCPRWPTRRRCWRACQAGALAGSASATGQPISTYVSFISGPSRSADIELSLSLGVHGPRHVHIVLLDNGREAIRANPRMRAALQCVRCGACSNVCPVYQQVGGHAMGHIYTGPIGLLVTPYHHGLDHVAGPQSLCAGCGACASVCPAGIPIPDLILDVREQAVAEGHSSNGLKQRALGALADERLLERGARLAGKAPWLQALAGRLPGSPLKRRPLPRVQGRPFRDRIGDLAAPNPKAATRVAYFPGCLTDWLRRTPGRRRWRCWRRWG